MLRPLWMGMLNFGLVSMPVKLYSAMNNSGAVHFNHLHASDHGRVYTKRFCPVDEEEVAFEELVRGYEIAPERYVVVEDDELAAVAPEFTRTIEIEDFVELDGIDRVYLERPYYVVPSRGGAKSYRLLQRAMQATGKVAIGRVVLRSRERLVMIGTREDTMLMTTLHFGDELRPTSMLKELGGTEPQISERELAVARRLVQALAEPFDASRYRDTYREAILNLIDRKASGEEVETEPRIQRQATATPDLMGALQASLEQLRERGGGDERGGEDERSAEAQREDQILA